MGRGSGVRGEFVKSREPREPPPFLFPVSLPAQGKRVEEKDDSLTNFESQPRDVHRAGGRANICADIILGKKRRRLKLSGELEHGLEDNKRNGRGK